MSEYTEKENKLSLKWLPLAWFSFILTGLVFGIIGGIVQGDPNTLILKIGISDLAIFYLLMQGIGILIAVGFLYKLLREIWIGIRCCWLER